MPFIKTLTDHQTFGDRIHPAGAIIEVERAVAKRLVERRVAEIADGPPPEPPSEPSKSTPAKAPTK